MDARITELLEELKQAIDKAATTGDKCPVSYTHLDVYKRQVYDITYTSIGAAVVEDFYDENVVFLRFWLEKELLKKNPLDRYDRILRMVYLKDVYKRQQWRYSLSHDRGSRSG